MELQSVCDSFLFEVETVTIVATIHIGSRRFTQDFMYRIVKSENETNEAKQIENYFWWAKLFI